MAIYIAFKTNIKDTHKHSLTHAHTHTLGAGPGVFQAPGSWLVLAGIRFHNEDEWILLRHLLRPYKPYFIFHCASLPASRFHPATVSSSSSSFSSSSSSSSLQVKNPLSSLTFFHLQWRRQQHLLYRFVKVTCSCRSVSSSPLTLRCAAALRSLPAALPSTTPDLFLDWLHQS